MPVSMDYLKSLYTYKNGELFWKVNKGSVKAGDKVGYFNGRYFVSKLDGKLQQLSRLIFTYHNGYIPKYIDHINGNTKDNRIENLREVTAAQNNHNRAIAKNNKSGVKGLSFSKASKKWKAQIEINYKQIHLGYFVDKELAELVINEARNKYHGQYAFNGVR